LLDGLLAALDRCSLMEFLQELKLCKERGRRQLTFFEARTYGSSKNCSYPGTAQWPLYTRFLVHRRGDPHLAARRTPCRQAKNPLLSRILCFMKSSS